MPPSSPLPHMLGSPCISGRGTLSSGVAWTRAHSSPPACPQAHLPARERPPGVNNHLSVFLLAGFSLSSRLIHPQALTRGLNTQSVFGRPCGDFWSLLVTPPGRSSRSAAQLGSRPPLVSILRSPLLVPRVGFPWIPRLLLSWLLLCWWSVSS